MIIYRYGSFIICTAFVFIVLFLIGVREDGVGADTFAYRDFYTNILKYIDHSRFEPGFLYSAYLSYIVYPSVELYFSFIAFLITIAYLLTVRRVVRVTEGNDYHLYSSLYPLLLGILFFSSWYLTMTTNGLRQGVALSFLYLSIVSIRHSYLQFFIVISVAISFHYSILLLLPFVIIFFVSFNVAMLMFLLSSIFAYTGISKIVIYYASMYTGVGVYDFVSSYAAGTKGGELYHGYRLDIFLYTLLYPIALYISGMFFMTRVSFTYFKQLLVIYFFLSMPYFYFGFAAYSNRYGVMAWFFLPLLLTFFVYFSRFNAESKSYISWTILTLGFMYMSNIFLGVI